MAANLTSVAISTRKVIRYGILFVILITVARGIIGVSINVYNTVVPKPTAAPTARFGPLPLLPFPKPNQELPTFNFTIETATGNLPQFETQAKVYYMPGYATNLFSSDNSQRKAAALGFESEPLKLSQTLYRYTTKAFPATLEMNIATNAFSISYNLAANPAPLSQVAPTPGAAIDSARQILSTINALPQDMAEGTNGTEFLRIDGQNLVHALSLSEANFVRVNLFRKKYDELGSVTADPNRGVIWFIIAGGSAGKTQNVIAAQYRYYPIDEKKFETYPIKTSAQALEELKAGKGYIANLGINRDGNVTIRDISLAYFDSENEMQFYQPVFVFRGDRDFVGYVPAVTEQFYGK